MYVNNSFPYFHVYLARPQKWSAPTHKSPKAFFGLAISGILSVNYDYLIVYLFKVEPKIANTSSSKPSF